MNNYIINKFVDFLKKYKVALYTVYIDEKKLGRFRNNPYFQSVNSIPSDAIKWPEEVVYIKEDIDVILKFLTGDYKKSEMVSYFEGFNSLSILMRESELSSAEMFDILITFININISILGTLMNETVDVPMFRADELLNYNFRTIKRGFIDLDDVWRILNDQTPNKNWDQSQIDELLKVLDEISISVDVIREPHKIIKEGYLDKKNTYQLEDIIKICGAFKTLGVDTDIVDGIKKYLETRLFNRPKSKGKDKKRTNRVGNSKATTSDYSYKAGKQKPTQSDLEYQWVRECVDFRTLKPRKYLTLDERIRVVAWLLDDYSNEDIKNIFLAGCQNISCDRDISLIDGFNELKPKLDYCIEKNIFVCLNEYSLRDLERSVHRECISDPSLKAERLTKLLTVMLSEGNEWKKFLNYFGYELSKARELKENKKNGIFGK